VKGKGIMTTYFLLGKKSGLQRGKSFVTTSESFDDTEDEEETKKWVLG
jgi:hypothetical protein